MKGNLRELKKLEKGLRKFELVDGSFQELGARKVAHLVGQWSYYKRFGV